MNVSRKQIIREFVSVKQERYLHRRQIPRKLHNRNAQNMVMTIRMITSQKGIVSAKNRNTNAVSKAQLSETR
ncbi:hypothetical protein C0J52_00048 [Blattella germanica]|nr:hypothetical protein C0J52_00048 [Blattella germanica]